MCEGRCPTFVRVGRARVLGASVSAVFMSIMEFSRDNPYMPATAYAHHIRIHV